MKNRLNLNFENMIIKRKFIPAATKPIKINYEFI